MRPPSASGSTGASFPPPPPRTMLVRRPGMRSGLQSGLLRLRFRAAGQLASSWQAESATCAGSQGPWQALATLPRPDSRARGPALAALPPGREDPREPHAAPSAIGNASARRHGSQARGSRAASGLPSEPGTLGARWPRHGRCRARRDNALAPCCERLGPLAGSGPRSHWPSLMALHELRVLSGCSAHRVPSMRSEHAPSEEALCPLGRLAAPAAGG